eukprot:3153647-Pyramimonas_sp.AAC.2
MPRGATYLVRTHNPKKYPTRLRFVPSELGICRSFRVVHTRRRRSVPPVRTTVEERFSEELSTSSNVSDPLLKELYERRKELYNTEQKWRMMAKEGVDCCFEDIAVQPLRCLDRNTMRNALQTVKVSPRLLRHTLHLPLKREDVDKLKAVHCTEAQELLSKHLATTTRDTAPIVVGSYQIRMPPMVGRGDIAIPFLFLEQGPRGEQCEKVGNWTQGEKRVSGVLSAPLPLLAQEEP